MKDWMQKQLDSGFADWTGLSIDASVPLRDSLVNELLAEALRSAGEKQPAPSAAAPDLRPLARFVEKAEVRTAEGVMVLNVAVKVR